MENRIPLPFIRSRALTVSKDLVCLSALILFFGAVQLFSLRTGLHFEEGRDGSVFWGALNGILPYRDFDWFYGPFSFFVYPQILKWFGSQVIVLRVAYFCLILVSVGILYLIARKFLEPLGAAIAAFTGSSLLQIPFYTYNHAFYLNGYLLGTLFLLTWKKTEKNHWLLFSGFAYGIAFLTKPIPSGVLVMGALGIWLTLRGNLRRVAVPFGAAFLLPVVSYGIYLFRATYLIGRNLEYRLAFKAGSFLDLEKGDRLTAGAIFENVKERVAKLFFLFPAMTGKEFSLKEAILDHNTAVTLVFPLLIPLLYFLFIRRSKRLESSKVADFDLLALLGLAISFEMLLMPHGMNRAFTSQLSLLLGFAVFYHLWTKRAYQTALVCGFALYFSSVGFFYFPIGKYLQFDTEPDLPRTRGIFLAGPDARFFEELKKTMDFAGSPEEKVSVLGYYPNLAFFSNREDTLAKDYLHQKLHIARTRSRDGKSPYWLNYLKGLESELVDRLETDGAKFFIVPVNDPRHEHYQNYLDTFFARLNTKYELLRTFEKVDPYGANMYKIDMQVWVRR